MKKLTAVLTGVAVLIGALMVTVVLVHKKDTCFTYNEYGDTYCGDADYLHTAFIIEGRSRVVGFGETPVECMRYALIAQGTYGWTQEIRASFEVGCRTA